MVPENSACILKKKQICRKLLLCIMCVYQTCTLGRAARDWRIVHTTAQQEERRLPMSCTTWVLRHTYICKIYKIYQIYFRKVHACKCIHTEAQQRERRLPMFCTSWVQVQRQMQIKVNFQKYTCRTCTQGKIGPKEANAELHFWECIILVCKF